MQFLTNNNKCLEFLSFPCTDSFSTSSSKAPCDTEKTVKCHWTLFPHPLLKMISCGSFRSLVYVVMHMLSYIYVVIHTTKGRVKQDKLK